MSKEKLRQPSIIINDDILKNETLKIIRMKTILRSWEDITDRDEFVYCITRF